MKIIFAIFILISTSFLTTVFAEEPADSSSMEISADAQYHQLTNEISSLLSSVNPQTAQRLKNKSKDHKSKLSRQERLLKGRYLKLMDELEYWEPVYQLSQNLQEIYWQHHRQNDPANEEYPLKLQKESDKLARQIVGAIITFDQVYKTGHLPLANNLFIKMGLKQRGSCEDWTEDLLTAIEGVDHPHFMVYWAEAYPHTIKEHNSVVITARDQPFKNGLVIDPWRTGGKPFWIKVDSDKYPWQPWKDYQPR